MCILKKREDSLKLSIYELGLSARAVNCLSEANIDGVGQLVNKSSKEILKIRNLGKGTFREIGNALAGLGLCFQGEIVELPLKPQCFNCAWSKPKTEHIGLFECRRYAPRGGNDFVNGEANFNNPTLMPHAWWPVVFDEDFCGEFKAKS